MIDGLSPNDIWRAFLLWRFGNDTLQIALKLGTNEATIWNALTEIRRNRVVPEKETAA